MVERRTCIRGMDDQWRSGRSIRTRGRSASGRRARHFPDAVITGAGPTIAGETCPGPMGVCCPWGAAYMMQFAALRQFLLAAGGRDGGAELLQRTQPVRFPHQHGRRTDHQCQEQRPLPAKEGGLGSWKAREHGSAGGGGVQSYQAPQDREAGALIRQPGALSSARVDAPMSWRVSPPRSVSPYPWQA